ncbi:hypothetical protein BU24DRAFT_458646 [Aaosphaeria arxii CBS 175.79]|uniref:Uncharacterized protein n=1 Tax=Aaosphaeria arxii CBS 175.79 TaxID=1450172 RepID=A0A6A5Y062_9PLEO|nr:uncharacterized protein BU24DRAFT_458646 [Aaosphaeria arxii CBS 175.79]KAF2018918.1 hypothetical protein BU24DRAFT_458646 [Aaosphaeria arxii CBS 175.79]
MTDAATKHGLSKLDLFTPNPLHASLPPLTHGTYNCMGTAAVMLLETDVLARKTHIHGLLAAASGPDAVTPPALNRRVAAHTRIAAALGIAWYQVYWRNVGHGDGGGGGDFAPPSADMQSLRAGKLHYAREQIKRQWAAMGLEETELDLEGYW